MTGGTTSLVNEVAAVASQDPAAPTHTEVISSVRGWHADNLMHSE
ncbi:hypothetical protein FRAAL4494 [Frankia alni ACN14a]|uniref:Uncharacterized protein n=1 Tax=Frankia alni (strain DSM 45986 / CECT 9034 / ACN14a) TaxID=326424 RepID=Q0RH95_FRAAA|nr:hypothetical protein FRAAL4494 [Frankia alni ACN14a]